jgi:hypothetical protein
MNQFLITTTSIKKVRQHIIPEEKYIKIKNIRSHSLADKKKNMELAKQNFINFLISDEIENADLNQIETYQINRMIRNSNELDDLRKKVIDAEEKLKSTESQIQKEIIINFKLNDQEIIDETNKDIEEIKEILSAEQHRKDCYINVYNNIYQQNYLLKKKFAEQLNYQQISLKYFNKYKVIKVNAMNSLSKQIGIIKELKAIDDSNTITYTLKLKEKSSNFNDLEFKVENFKEDTKVIQEKLEDLHCEIVIAHNSIADANRKIAKSREENNCIRREYIKTKIVLYKIYHNLKVDTIEDVIKRFNDIQFKNNDYSLRFQYLNKTITELTCIYSTHMQRLRDLCNRLKNKRDAKDNNEITKLYTLFLEQNKYNNLLMDKIESLENLLFSIMNFMINYEDKIAKLVTKLNHHHSKKGRPKINILISNFETFRNMAWNIDDGNIF